MKVAVAEAGVVAAIAVELAWATAAGKPCTKGLVCSKMPVPTGVTESKMRGSSTSMVKALPALNWDRDRIKGGELGKSLPS